MYKIDVLSIKDDCTSEVEVQLHQKIFTNGWFTLLSCYFSVEKIFLVSITSGIR